MKASRAFQISWFFKSKIRKEMLEHSNRSQMETLLFMLFVGNSGGIGGTFNFFSLVGHLEAWVDE